MDEAIFLNYYYSLLIITSILFPATLLVSTPVVASPDLSGSLTSTATIACARWATKTSLAQFVRISGVWPSVGLHCARVIDAINNIESATQFQGKPGEYVFQKKIAIAYIYR